MKRERRKRKIKAKLSIAKKGQADTKQPTSKITKYISMSRCYWERWQWELAQRKEMKSKSIVVRVGSQLLEVDLLQLKNPNDREMKVYNYW